MAVVLKQTETLAYHKSMESILATNHINYLWSRKIWAVWDILPSHMDQHLDPGREWPQLLPLHMMLGFAMWALRELLRERARGREVVIHPIEIISTLAGAVLSGDSLSIKIELKKTPGFHLAIFEAGVGDSLKVSGVIRFTFELVGRIPNGSTTDAMSAELSKAKTAMSRSEICQRIPHGSDIVLLDRIVELPGTKQLAGIWNISRADCLLNDGRAYFCHSLLAEAFGQFFSAIVLEPGEAGIFTGSSSLKMVDLIRVGDQLIITTPADLGFIKEYPKVPVLCQASLCGTPVASMDFMFKKISSPEAMKRCLRL